MKVNDIGLACIMDSARHSSVQNSKTYLQDSLCRFRRDENDPNRSKTADVSRWISIYSHSQTLLEVNQDSLNSHLRKPLPQLAQWWYEKLGFSADSNASCFDVLDRAKFLCGKKVGNTPTVDELSKRIVELARNELVDSETKSSSITAFLKQLVEACNKPHEEGCEDLHENNGELPMSETTRQQQKRSAESESIEGETRNKKQKSSGGQNRGGTLLMGDSRKNITKTVGDHSLPLAERVQALMDFHGTWKSHANELVSRDRDFLNRVRRTTHCVASCHDGSAEDFARSINGKFAFSKFSCQNCGKK